MAAKGAISKVQIANKILEQFPGSFLYNDNKEIRINMMEDGQPVQIKITLTASKTIVEGGGKAIETDNGKIDFEAPSVKENIPTEPSEEEKQRVIDLLDRLGIN